MNQRSERCSRSMCSHQPSACLFSGVWCILRFEQRLFTRMRSLFLYALTHKKSPPASSVDKLASVSVVCSRVPGTCLGCNLDGCRLEIEAEYGLLGYGDRFKTGMEVAMIRRCWGSPAGHSAAAAAGATTAGRRRGTHSPSSPSC